MEKVYECYIYLDHNTGNTKHAFEEICNLKMYIPFSNKFIDLR